MMSRFFCLFLVGAALFSGSCARVGGSTDPVALQLSWSPTRASKVDVLQAGDAAGLFVRVDGQEAFAVLNHRFLSDAAGVLSGDPMVYYPDAEQAVGICAYVPFQAGQTDPSRVAYSVPTDQTTDAAFRSADLLWGRVSTTPVSVSVPISFEHVLSRLEVSVSNGSGVAQGVDRWSVRRVRTGGTLQVETGGFTLDPTQTQTQATASGRSELILPAQSVQFFECTVGGVDYSFESAAPIVLESGRSYRLNLEVSQDVRTVRLVDPIVATDWVLGSGTGSTDEQASNRFTVYWALPSVGYQGATRSVVHLTTKQGVELEVAATNFTALSVDQPGMCTYSFDLSSVGVTYPYTIRGVSFFDGSGRLIQLCSSLLGAHVYRSGAYTLGIQAGNILSLVEGRVNSFTEVFGSGSISGGVANQFVLQLLEPEATGYDYTKVRQVRLTADGVVYDFPSTTFASGSNILVATTDWFAFAGSRPAGYPYTVERVELLGSGGSSLGGMVGVFDADVMVSRGGLITMQLFRGKATGLVSGSSFVAYGVSGATDAPIFTGTVRSTPVELVYALGNGTPALGKQATSVSKAVVTVHTSDGLSHTVSLSPYTMLGTPLSARSSGVIDMVLGLGWPVAAQYPYQITHIALYDGLGQPVVPLTAFSTPLEVRWGTKVTLSVMKYN